MAKTDLEAKVIGEVDIPFRIIGKRIKEGFFGPKFIVSCISNQVGQGFRIKVDERLFHLLKKGKDYTLNKTPVYQNYDKNSSPVGGLYVRPSNLFFGQYF